jgi:hypothetical protein
MRRIHRFLPLVALALLAAPRHTQAQSLVLDPLSASLVGIPATSSDILRPSTAPPAAPLPVVGLTNAQLGLLPGDVIDALWYFDDPPPGAPGVTVYFSVSRGPMGPPPFTVPDVNAESAFFLPPLTQDEAASDLFVSNDLSCIPFGLHTQILDGNGALLGPPSICGYGGGAPFGLGLTELLPTPPVAFNDNLSAFDWGTAGRGRLFCITLSLAPGSPSLVPAANPLLLPPLGATPADVLVSCPGPAAYSSPVLFMFAPGAALGLLPGDDIDALGGGVTFSLTPTSTSVTGPPFFSAADLLGPGPAIVLPAAVLGLLPTDDVDALESSTNPCPGVIAGDLPDFDGVMPGPGCDNCPAVFNPGQEDTDSDGIGDACDPCTDSDGDTFGNIDFPANTCAIDLCPFTPSTNADLDADGVGDECDNCPAIVNPGQADTDFDGDGNVCDNCPVDADPTQADGDGDSIGDVCDICTAGVGMTKAQLKLNKLLAPAADDQLQAQGDLSFLGLTLPIPPLSVHLLGMRLQIVDIGAGSTVLLDHTIPGGIVPNVCGPKDGWKANGPLTSEKFATKTNSIPAACLPGSALGIAQAQAQDKTAKLKGGKFKVKGKNGTYAPAIGPFRMTVVLGGALESAGGQCAQHTFPAPNCTTSGGGKQIKCK